EFQLFTKYNVISHLLSTISVGSAIFFSKDILVILLTYFTVWTISRSFFSLRIVSKCKIEVQKDTKSIRYGKHLTLMNVINTVAEHIDKILIFHYLGAAQLAIYAFSIAFPEQIKGFLKNIATMAMPKFADRSMQDIKKTILKKMAILILFCIPIIILYILLAPVIFNLILPQYTESIFYSQLFSVSLLSIAGSLPLSALRAHAVKNKLYAYNITTSLFQIVVLFFLVRYFGVLGAITTRVIVRLVSTFFAFYLTQKN
ncbi:MAG: oligosaccharide flippase family protein, partial [Candidatus Magasanikbacteria bacterium]